jgi:hypothetical protein
MEGVFSGALSGIAQEGWPCFDHCGCRYRGTATGARSESRAQSEPVIYAVEDAVFLANELYDLALLRFGGGNMQYEWD